MTIKVQYLSFLLKGNVAANEAYSETYKLEYKFNLYRLLLFWQIPLGKFKDNFESINSPFKVSVLLWQFGWFKKNRFHA